MSKTTGKKGAHTMGASEKTEAPGSGSTDGDAEKETQMGNMGLRESR